MKPITDIDSEISNLVDQFLILGKKMDQYTVHSIILARGDMKTQLKRLIARTVIKELIEVEREAMSAGSVWKYL